MATFSISVNNKQILFNICVRNDANEPLKYYFALFDTGAQMTMILENIVNDLNLQPIGDVDIIPVSGQPIKTESYMIRLDVPITQNVVLSDGKTGSHDNLFGLADCLRADTPAFDDLADFF